MNTGTIQSKTYGLKDNNGQISTEGPLDKKLFGGFNRGELNIFAGSGSGKSLFMQNPAVNHNGRLNGVYVTLELSEGLCAMRIDSMVTDAYKEIFKDLDTVEMKIGMTSKKAGSLRIKYLPTK